MASTADLSTVTSSAQILSANYTLPQIRAILKSLQAQADDKANRLRTQVGGSYRELLGTADAIVRMRDDNDDVQALLGRMADRCGRQVVEAKTTGLAKFEAARDDRHVRRAARRILLDACELAVGRQLRTRGKGRGLVLAAKVWVLMRLLVKSVAEDGDAEREKKALATLRRRLLSRVNGVLQQAGDDDGVDNGFIDGVLDALCAYSLVTSSGAKEVLRHFLAVRKEAIGLALAAEQGQRAAWTDDDVASSLKRYTQTLLDAQALVPTRLAAALASLKSHALLDDDAVRQLEGLRLDVYQPWCSDEVICFTPFIRHDDLDAPQAREMLAAWDEQSTTLLLDGLRKTLEHMADLKSITELRTRLLQLWIRSGARIRDKDAAAMLNELRGAINARMLAVIQASVSKLHLVASQVEATLDAWHDGASDKQTSLWDTDDYDAALATGAGPFVHQIVARLYGRNDAVSRAVGSYTSWLQVVAGVRATTAQMRAQRWENDDDEIEDEDTLSARQQLLSDDDARALLDTLATATDTAFVALNTQLDALWHHHAASSPSAGPMAVFLVRVVRDIRAQLPPAQPNLARFALDSVPALHAAIAAHVAAAPLGDFAAALGDDAARRPVQGRALWDGDPALPNQPSPSVFGLLHGLALAMAHAGADLWTAVAVATLKRHACSRVGQVWEEKLRVFEASKHDSSNQDSQNETSKNEDSKVQDSKDQETSKDQDSKDQDSKDQDSSNKDEAHTEHPTTANETPDDATNQDDAQQQPPDPDTSKPSAAETAPDGTAEHMQDLAIQWLFDVDFLANCIGNTSPPSPDLARLEHLVSAQHTGLDSPARQRIAKSAKDYCQRTSLLFGLLS